MFCFILETKVPTKKSLCAPNQETQEETPKSLMQIEMDRCSEQGIVKDISALEVSSISDVLSKNVEGAEMTKDPLDISPFSETNGTLYNLAQLFPFCFF